MDLRYILSKRKEFVIPPHPLNSFKIQKYYQNEPRFNGVIYGWIYVKII